MKPRTAEAARLEADYLARVKVAIAGREASEIDEIIGSLREHIEEELSETDDDRVGLVQMANVLEQLGPPEAYGQEEGATPVPVPNTKVAPAPTTDQIDPRYSRLAIAAAICFPAGFFVYALVVALAPNNGESGAACGVALLVSQLTAMALGIAALVNIRNARQKMRGRFLAWFAIAGPVLLLVLPGLLWFTYSSR